MLIRFHDWTSRLASFLLANRTRSFQYGQWDCALFVSGAIESMTGTDTAAWFRGRYASRREARLAMHERTGTANFESFVDRMFGLEFEMPGIPMSQATPGDAILAQIGDRRLLGLLALDAAHVIIAGDTPAGESGLGYIPLEKGVRGWRV